MSWPSGRLYALVRDRPDLLQILRNWALSWHLGGGVVTEDPGEGLSQGHFQASCVPHSCKPCSKHFSTFDLRALQSSAVCFGLEKHLNILGRRPGSRNWVTHGRDIVSPAVGLQAMPSPILALQVKSNEDRSVELGHGDGLGQG